MDETRGYEVARRIKRLRTERGYSREEFASMIGVTSKFMYEVETFRKGFSVYRLVDIAKALEVSCDYVMTGEDPYGLRVDELFIGKLEPGMLGKAGKLLQLAYELAEQKKRENK